MISFGKKDAPKYLTYVYGKEWDREEYKMFSFRKTPLGWDFNIWRFMLSYDDYSKVR
jgi:hypothetical protein